MKPLRRCRLLQTFLLLLCSAFILHNIALIYKQSLDLDRIFQNILCIRRGLLLRVQSNLSQSLHRSRRLSQNESAYVDIRQSHIDLGRLLHLSRTTGDQYVLLNVPEPPPSTDTIPKVVNPFNKHDDNDNELPVRTSSTPVLIVAYLRSGSSWLGDIIYRSNEAFYMFEPFKPFQRQAYYTEGYVCYNNNTCRIATALTDRHSFALFMIQQLFNCRFERLPDAMLRYLIYGSNTETKEMFSACMKKHWNETICLNRLKAICLSSSLRVIKTIRISMTLVGKLLESVPDLKVIHLLRDPRAVTNSRQKGFFSMSYDIDSHSVNLCGRMETDYDEAEALKSKYPGRIRTVIYESLAERTHEGIRELYEFLSLNSSETFLKWVDIYSDGLGNNGYYNTHRKDPSAIAVRWRTKMSFAMTQIVDAYCGGIYAKVGYRQLETEEDQHNLSYSTWEEQHKVD